jgi:starch synthase (maltosyl-transferring)
MTEEERKRVVISSVQPEIEAGRFPAKRVVGEKVVVTADIFVDGHDSVAARLFYRKKGATEWQETLMSFLLNDRWRGEFTVQELGEYQFTLSAWVDHFTTWQKALGKKYEAGQDVSVELLMGAQFLEEGATRASGDDSRRLHELAVILREVDNHARSVSVALNKESSDLMGRYPDTRFATCYEKELDVLVDRKKALFSTWYERFPRSCCTESGKHGTFRDCERLLPEIARMGFDVLYLPPIHPIGRTKRKGINNSPVGASGDPGSPWAIGAEEGGHKSIHSELGTMEDFESLLRKAGEYGIELALDIALQCSPDHPYVREHPDWFKWRPDGTVQFAENPPKRYEDIFPINFETDQWRELWEELKSVFLHWIDRGVRIFRVDNPHTKPFAFWEWLITEIKRDYPEVIFLSEAFTRPKVMYRLAKLGFTQSYTYFTWRNSKKELTDYLEELTQTEVREFFKPNFWPNTPDILPEYLQYGGRPAFIIKLILAATLSSNYGIYGPAFELLVNEALPQKEEYLNSEKYEIKQWNWDQPGNLRDFVARLNRIRRENPALQTTWNLKFYEVDNDQLLFYGKEGEGLDDSMLIVVNLDPFHIQSGRLRIPIKEYGIQPDQPYLCHDLLSEDKFIWHGERNFIQLNPHTLPAHIFRLRKRMRRETDFDYFM